MSLVSSPTGFTDALLEVRRLRRQLAQERARRRTAESMGQPSRPDVPDSTHGLRTAQVELLESADRIRVVDELAQALRQDLDAAHLANRAAESAGLAARVDRCDVLLVDAERYSADNGTWASSREFAELPHPSSFVELPEVLTTLLLEAAQQLSALQVEDIDDDARFGSQGAQEVLAALGVRALAAVPLAVGEEIVGWLLLRSVMPRRWEAMEMAVCDGLAHDLVSSLIQSRAFDQQRQTMRQLEELDRAKDAFISTVSHELRTPLSSIVGYLELLSEGSLGALAEPASHGVQIIERNVDRLRDLVENLLILSDFDAGAVRPDLVPTDLLAIVRTCVEILAETAAAKPVELGVEPDLPDVLAEGPHLQRVVLNLLDNAVKFGDVGGSVRVCLRRQDPDVVLTVSDDGPGIPESEQKWIFSRFFRTQRAVTEEIRGAGLGLPLVKTIVESYGGRVDIESVEGEGTTVTVRVPQAP